MSDDKNRATLFSADEHGGVNVSSVDVTIDERGVTFSSRINDALEMKMKGTRADGTTIDFPLGLSSAGTKITMVSAIVDAITRAQGKTLDKDTLVKLISDLDIDGFTDAATSKTLTELLARFPLTDTTELRAGSAPVRMATLEKIASALEEITVANATRWALEKYAGTGDELANHAKAFLYLRSEIEAGLLDLDGLYENPTTVKKLPPLERNAALATAIARFGGKTGTEVAKKLRKESEEDAERHWLQNLRPYRELALVQWLEKVRPQLERATQKPAALAMLVHEPVARLWSRVAQEEERNGQRVLALSGETMVRVAAVDEDISRLLVDRGIKLFGTVTAHRLLRWQVFTGHKQALEGHPDPRVLTVDGGFSALAGDILGATTKKAAEEVRALIEAEHSIELPIQPGTGTQWGRLLNRAIIPSRRGRRGQLLLTLGPLLLPNYVHTLKKLGAAAHNMRLVPVLDLPPFAGKQERSWGPQATLSMLFVERIRANARELKQHGGVLFTDDTIATLARTAGLAQTLVAEVMDRWTQDGTDKPAFLKRTGKNRFTLGDAHKDARDFIESGGLAEINGSNAGKAGVRRKRARLAKSGHDY